ncbi:MAG: hypothetical protein PHN49_12785 [Candidatus Omnitrophica bacterium]|nr:hypothetical protein [Candidatus Omnitrophota bacterium]MDD5672502.1 hypothetical protein [Candidatus Omnitrophota bacterium]
MLSIRKVSTVVLFVCVLSLIPRNLFAGVKCPEPGQVQAQKVDKDWYLLAGDPTKCGSFVHAEIGQGKFVCLYRNDVVMVYDKKWFPPQPENAEVWKKTGQVRQCEAGIDECTIK